MKKCILSIMVVCVAIMSQAQHVLENEAALVYYMPKNEVVITLEYDVVEQTPGVFYQYAERYLGTKNVITEEQNSCYLTGIQTELTATADRQREYKITAAQGIQEQLIRLSEDGRLLGYGIEYDTKVPTACPAGYSVGGNKVENVKYKGEEELMPLLEEQFLASSVAKMAEGAAKQIYRIREMRLNLLASEVEHVPADGEAMKLVLEELNNREQALAELFVGKTVVRHAQHKIKYEPVKCVNKAVLCRFSKHSGVVAPDDLSGEPIYISVDATQELVQTPLEVSSKAPALSQLYYNLPGEAQMLITYKGKELVNEHYQIAQLGVAIPLAKQLFTGKQSPVIRINPATGNILSIEQ